MSIKRILSMTAAAALLVLSACGGHGVPLGDFPAINKVEGDAPFDLVAPSSDSPGQFVFTSSNPAVATIVGKTVTVHVAGTSTITASQPQTGSYNPTSTSTLLTVTARVCEPPSVRENGQCVAPATTAAFVTRGEVVWMPASFVLDWAKADAFCKNTTIQGKTGWKLPTQAELKALIDSGQLVGQNWATGDAWTADAGAGASTHVALNLTSSVATPSGSDVKAYVTCLR
jgi:predicted small lipoprotein YifL